MKKISTSHSPLVAVPTPLPPLAFPLSLSRSPHRTARQAAHTRGRFPSLVAAQGRRRESEGEGASGGGTKEKSHAFPFRPSFFESLRHPPPAAAPSRRRLFRPRFPPCAAWPAARSRKIFVGGLNWATGEGACL